MPSISQSYEVILDFTNDTLDSATVQLLRDYGRPSNRIILLNPGETMSLVLAAGDTYKYTLKTKYKVVNVTSVIIFPKLVKISNTLTYTCALNQTTTTIIQSSSMERRRVWTLPTFPPRFLSMAASRRISKNTSERHYSWSPFPWNTILYIWL